MDIGELLTFGTKNGVSDLHLSAGVSPMMRGGGGMKKIDVPPLTHSQVRDMIYDVMNDKQRKQYEKYLECDFSFEIPSVARFRVNAFNQNRGAAAVFRTIPSLILTLDQINAPDAFKEYAMTHSGLVLVTGGTGSGKSTTLAAMMDYRNTNAGGHILTLEDPIEFVHQSKKCLISQREIGRDTLGFGEALKSALRQDPDVILVGELRDLETIKLALSASETGHVVFGTLHTSSAAKTVERIVNAFPAAEKPTIRAMLSETIKVIVAQSLLKKVGGGRVAAHEILVATPSIRNLIRENKTAQMFSALQTGQKYGMQTLDQVLQKLVKDGVITKEAARDKAANANLFL
jgi:twitching motility protein PilT